MRDCLSRKHNSSEEKEKIDVFQARVGNVDPEQRLRLIFNELQELESDICQRSKKSRQKSDNFWWFEILFTTCMTGGSAAVTIVTAFTDDKNIPVLVLGAVMFFVATMNKVLRLGDRGFTYRQGNHRLQKIRQQIRNTMYNFQDNTPEQLLVLINKIRNDIDDIDLELYRSNMTGNVQFDDNFQIKVEDNNQDSEKKPSEIHIHLDSQHSSPNNSHSNTPNMSPKINRQSPYFQRNIERLSRVKAVSDSQILMKNSLEVPKNKEEQHSMPILEISEEDSIQ